VKGIKEETSSVEGQSARTLAERWGLPYREAHTLSIDPAALEIVDRDESRRLRVLPLEVGTDGPVFAVSEPSEERFAEVREIAGDNATFVLVERETLDALLNSKVFSVPNNPRRPSLFRSRTDGTTTEPIANTEAESTEDPGSTAFDGNSEAAPSEPRAETETGGETAEEAEPMAVPESSVPESSEALETLFSKIASGAGSLRAQVSALNESLEAAQSELRHSNEQLAEAHRNDEAHHEVVGALNSEIQTLQEQLSVAKTSNEAHDEVVTGLETEIRSLQEQLAVSTAVNDSMTARLEEVARALMEPSAGADDG
jgi:Skp family chaperone for outer membrane proteins